MNSPIKAHELSTTSVSAMAPITLEIKGPCKTILCLSEECQSVVIETSIALTASSTCFAPARTNVLTF